MAINLASNAPILVTTPERFPEDERILAVRKACLTGAVSPLFVTISGNASFRSLDVSRDALRVAGGILLTIVAMEMLHAIAHLLERARKTRKITAKKRAFRLCLSEFWSFHDRNRSLLVRQGSA